MIARPKILGAMPRMVRQTIAISLVACLLGLAGLVYPQTVAHAGHHAHHKATTHSTALCSWLCAAGQAQEAAPFWQQPEIDPLIFVEVQASTQPPDAMLPAPSSRGPPPLS